MKDVFEMFRVISRERKKREIDPTIAMLRNCIAETKNGTDAHVRERLGDLLEFFELSESAYHQLETLPTSAVVKLAKIGDKGLRLLGINRK